MWWHIIDEIYLFWYAIILYPLIYIPLKLWWNINFSLTRILILWILIWISSSYYTSPRLYDYIIDEGIYYNIDWEKDRDGGFLSFDEYFNQLNRKEPVTIKSTYKSLDTNLLEQPSDIGKSSILLEFLKYYKLDGFKRLDSQITNRNEFKEVIRKFLREKIFLLEEDENDEIKFLREKYGISENEILLYMKEIDNFYSKEWKIENLNKPEYIDEKNLEFINTIRYSKSLNEFLDIFLKNLDIIKNKEEVTFIITELIKISNFSYKNNFEDQLSKIYGIYKPRTFTEEEIINSFKYWLPDVEDFKNLKLPSIWDKKNNKILWIFRFIL